MSVTGAWHGPDRTLTGPMVLAGQRGDGPGYVSVDRGLPMRRVIALLALTCAVPAVRPAHAADEPAADLRLEYARPEVAGDGSGVTWHWTMTNAGTAGAETVVATHRVSAGQQVVGVSPPCAAVAADVVCRFDAIRPGEKRLGWIRTAVRAKGGTLRVNAQVIWRERVLPEMSAGGSADSWGMSGTDVALPAPGPG